MRPGDATGRLPHSRLPELLSNALTVSFALLVVQTCGVVYGDIGASPLYTLREIFFGAETFGHVPMTHDHILGAVALIFWALLVLITTKYVLFVLYADNHGEGGVFA